MTKKEAVDHIFARFAEHGNRSYGEHVTELEHALQCATFAHRAGESDSLVAAVLLHDYGHLLHELGEDIAQRGVDARHEELGARALAEWFGPEVVEPGRLHVAAKRYLCWKDPEYLNGLSDASRQSLALQGGPMSDAEGMEFERLPYHSDGVKLRRYDDMGKIPGMSTLKLDDFRATLEALVRLPVETENGCAY